MVARVMVYLRQHGMAHMVFSPSPRFHKYTKNSPAIPLRRAVQSHEKYCVDLLAHLYFRPFHSHPLQICQPDSVEKGDKLS